MKETKTSKDIMQRVTDLEKTVAKLLPPKYLTRRQLADELSCSPRFVMDNPDLKSLERKIGGRILYLRYEVYKLIDNKKKELKMSHFDDANHYLYLIEEGHLLTFDQIQNTYGLTANQIEEAVKTGQIDPPIKRYFKEYYLRAEVELLIENSST